MPGEKKMLPVINYSRCIACGMCWMVCRENAMKRSGTKLPEADLDYCTGCGECANNCDLGAIEMTDGEK